MLEVKAEKQLICGLLLTVLNVIVFSLFVGKYCDYSETPLLVVSLQELYLFERCAPMVNHVLSIYIAIFNSSC